MQNNLYNYFPLNSARGLEHFLDIYNLYIIMIYIWELCMKIVGIWSRQEISPFNIEDISLNKAGIRII